MVKRLISSRNLEGDEQGIRFDVDVDGKIVRAHISYERLLERRPTRAELALPPKYLFEGKHDMVQAIVDDASAHGWSGTHDHRIV
jgi:hypothetical protein